MDGLEVVDEQRVSVGAERCFEPDVESVQTAIHGHVHLSESVVEVVVPFAAYLASNVSSEFDI